MAVILNKSLVHLSHVMFGKYSYYNAHTSLGVISDGPKHLLEAASNPANLKTMNGIIGYRRPGAVIVRE